MAKKRGFNPMSVEQWYKINGSSVLKEKVSERVHVRVCLNGECLFVGFLITKN